MPLTYASIAAATPGGGIPLSFDVPTAFASLDSLLLGGVYSAFSENDKVCPVGIISNKA